MRLIWRFLIRLFGIVVVIAVLVVLFAYSGIYNVAATYPDNAVVEWILDTTKDHSVLRHSAGIKTPSLDSHAMSRAGSVSYRKMCAGCHGAPGEPATGIARAFNPRPPDLAEAARELTARELFWVTRNGIRMTAMPAWGGELSDEKLWEIVAFLRRQTAR